jgi:hypothetical protein
MNTLLAHKKQNNLCSGNPILIGPSPDPHTASVDLDPLEKVPRWKKSRCTCHEPFFGELLGGAISPWGPISFVCIFRVSRKYVLFMEGNL